jgi:hypothetical protein
MGTGMEIDGMEMRWTLTFPEHNFGKFEPTYIFFGTVNGSSLDGLGG